MAALLLGLGSNLGDPYLQLETAVDLLATRVGQLHARSHWHRYSAVGGPRGQPDYVNGVVYLHTDLPLHETWQECQQIEKQMGRQRTVRWGPRTLDIDILLYDQKTEERPELVVPHPRLAFRRFVLEPAIEIAADWRHPRFGCTLGQLWQHWHNCQPLARLVARQWPPRTKAKWQSALAGLVVCVEQVEKLQARERWQVVFLTIDELLTPETRRESSATATVDPPLRIAAHFFWGCSYSDLQMELGENLKRVHPHALCRCAPWLELPSHFQQATEELVAALGMKPGWYENSP